MCVGSPEIRPIKIRNPKPQGALGISKKITNFITEYHEESKIQRSADCNGLQAARKILPMCGQQMHGQHVIDI